MCRLNPSGCGYLEALSLPQVNWFSHHKDNFFFFKSVQRLQRRLAPLPSRLCPTFRGGIYHSSVTGNKTTSSRSVHGKHHKYLLSTIHIRTVVQLQCSYNINTMRHIESSSYCTWPTAVATVHKYMYVNKPHFIGVLANWPTLWTHGNHPHPHPAPTHTLLTPCHTIIHIPTLVINL